MKRCPTCNRSYLDDAQRFCLDDGATLIEASASSFDPQATLAMPSAPQTAPPSNPYSSGAGQGSPGSGSGQNPYGSGAGQGSYGSGAGQGSYGSGAGQGSYGSGSGQNQQAGSWSPAGHGFSSAPTPAKRNMLPWILGGAAVLVIGLIGLIVVFVAVVSNSSNKNANNSNSTSNTNSSKNTNNSNSKPSTSTDVVIRSTDGQIQISAPPTWKSSTELNDKAELQASDTSKQMYLIVLTDNKRDYTDMDLDRHSRATLDVLTKAMTSSNKTGPTSLTIDGNPAVQYEVRGEIKSLNVVYLHTTVETPSHYQQIVAWTLQTTYDERERSLKNIIESFKEN